MRAWGKSGRGLVVNQPLIDQPAGRPDTAHDTGKASALLELSWELRDQVQRLAVAPDNEREQGTECLTLDDLDQLGYFGSRGARRRRIRQTFTLARLQGAAALWPQVRPGRLEAVRPRSDGA